jgi:hypothetical protein
MKNIIVPIFGVLRLYSVREIGQRTVKYQTRDLLRRKLIL